MNPRTLSSAQTFLMKVLFPAAWIFFFGLSPFELWFGKDSVPTPTSDPSSMKWQLLFIWIAGSAFLLWGCAGLKRVRIDNEFLYVSNYLREVAVPLNMIASVTENRWLNIHPVTVHFRVPTDFGQKIKFMPPTRFWNLSSHPVVQELREAAHL